MMKKKSAIDATVTSNRQNHPLSSLSLAAVCLRFDFVPVYAFVCFCVPEIVFVLFFYVFLSNVNLSYNVCVHVIDSVS